MRKVLVLNFFPAFVPPKSGGELRYFNMYQNLSRYYDVTLLSPTYSDHPEEVVTHSELFREYRVPKEQIYMELHARMDKENICPEVSALVCCLASQKKNRCHELYQELYAGADIIIHESPYMFDYDLFFGKDGKCRIYNSYNFETKLVRQMWKGPNAEKYIELIEERERRLVRECDLVFATSEEEREAFSAAFDVPAERICLAPNGIDTALYEPLREQPVYNPRKKAYFVGSAHPPNFEAAEFIASELAPACPEVDFLIAGKCCSALKNPPGNVFPLGFIDDAQKNELFAGCDIAINPMFSGAGTNLKTLEFLSCGMPMISTGVGVRGLELQDGMHFILASKETFAARLKECLQNPALLESVSAQGKRYVNQNYSWVGICETVHNRIEETVDGMSLKTRRPVVAVLNDYEMDRPLFGGSVRIYHLLRELSSRYEILSLCYHDSDEVRANQINAHDLHLSIPKTDAHRREETAVNKQYWASANDIISGYMVREDDYYLSIVKNLYSLADVVILEHPFMVHALDGLAGKPIIYESHNFEYALKSQMLKDHPLAQKLTGEVFEMEHRAMQISRMVVSVSENEVDKLKSFASSGGIQIEVVRNGVQIQKPRYSYERLKKLFGGRPLVVFMGSAHPPNIQAAKHIVEEIARDVPQCIFAIIGSVCGSFDRNTVPKNVLLFGMLSEEYKNFLLFCADIALNPMEEGAGSNLKLAEYFAFRIPTVTTPFGARGYDVANGVEAVVCPLSEFGREIRAIIGGEYDLKGMTSRAFELVERSLTWEVLGAQYAALIQRLLSQKRMLAVTYRYNQPPRGGAEVYLANVLTRIAGRGGMQVDVAALDIGDIVDKFRFACDYTRDPSVQVEEVPNFRCIKLKADSLSEKTQWKSSRLLYECVMREDLEMARQFEREYSDPLLMGGWHFPEQTAEGPRIWSSGECELFVADSSGLELCGHSPKPVELSVFADGRLVKKIRISNDFCVQVTELRSAVVLLSAASFTLPQKDPRPLSLYISSIRLERAGRWEPLDLSKSYRLFLMRHCAQAYIQALTVQAGQRNEKLDELFCQTRGPLSHTLEEWLDQNVANYDVVLGHNVPFYTSILAGKYAKKHGVPIVQLPHFHMDNDFYHWSPYHRMLKEADRVIAFPNVSIPCFFERIGANACALPGGGVDESAFEHIDTRPFEACYSSRKPFILVLGRKAGAKNYQAVIRAVETLNQRGADIQLVMVGRDYDGLPVTAAHTAYLGELPRQAVLGALKKCRFLVNMSDSESFGIVILEAWLAGKPVIVNQDCAAFRELVEDGVDGLLASQETLAERIEQLWSMDSLEKMAERGRQKVLGKYTWDGLSEQIEELLVQVCEEKKFTKEYGG